MRGSCRGCGTILRGAGGERVPGGADFAHLDWDVTARVAPDWARFGQEALVELGAAEATWAGGAVGAGRATDTGG